MLIFIILLVIITIINAYQFKYNAIVCRKVVSNHINYNRNDVSLMMAKDEDSISRRRNRRKRIDNKIAIETNDNDSNDSDSSNNDSISNNNNNNNKIKIDDTFVDKNKDVSMEDMFGLGNEQLRELLEQELPIPREDLITGNYTYYYYYYYYYYYQY